MLDIDYLYSIQLMVLPCFVESFCYVSVQLIAAVDPERTQIVSGAWYVVVCQCLRMYAACFHVAELMVVRVC